MKVQCISGSKFLKNGTWYNVNVISLDNNVNVISLDNNVYQLENHTDITWVTSWYHKINFITQQEVREQQLNKLLYD